MTSEKEAETGSRQPWWLSALTVLIVADIAVYTMWLGLGPNRTVGDRDLWMSSSILVLASATATIRALRAQSRLPWILMAAGMSLWTVADILYSFWIANVHPLPTPSLADPLYLVFYPLTYTGMVLLARRRIRHFHPSMALDGVIVALGVAAFGSITVHAVVNQGSSNLVAAIVAVAYPVGDLLLLIITLSCMVMLGWRSGRMWWGLAAGSLLFCISDTVYLLQGASYHQGTLVDAGWPAAMAAFALSNRTVSPERVRFEGTRLLILPAIGALASIAFLVAAADHNLPFPGVLLASSALLAVLVRTGFTFREVSALAETRRQALTDELTGLANRRSLYRRLDDLHGQGTPSHAFALVLLDLDRFKEINDALGHSVGDELLTQLGIRLSGQLGEGDLLARLGGDEFVLLLPSGTLESAEAVVAQMSIHIDASIGIALHPDHATTRSELMRCADVAMYHAKRHRSQYSVYDPSEETNSRDRLVRIEQLRDAIGTKQLVCYYQPKLELGTGAVIGAEALLRWEHPVRGLLAPVEFLPLAEQTGLIGELTLQVLDQALAQCARWRNSGHQLTVAVNLSATNLLDASLPQQVNAALTRHGLNPEALELEITEDTLMVDPNKAQLVLEELRAAGLRLSIDDYGTGYSSLSYLQDLPVDELKLDRAFITGISTRPRARAIVISTVALAQSLGLRLVAEGVESEEDWIELAGLGVDLAQGYWMSKPLHPDAFHNWVSQHRGMESLFGAEALSAASA